jgi:hypothetical protein
VLLLGVLLLAVLPQAHAADEGAPRHAVQNLPVGIGALLARDHSVVDAAILVEGHNHFKQREDTFGYVRYGYGQSRLEFGTGFGLSLSAISGFELHGLEEDRHAGLFVGIEPFSGRIELNTADSREDFYDWLPAASAGIQLAYGGCKMLPLLKGGGAIGNLGKSGIWPSANPAYGLAAHLNCNRFDLSTEVLHITRSAGNITLSVVDFSFMPVPQTVSLGARVETIENDSRQALGGTEKRAMLVFRGDLFR